MSDTIDACSGGLVRGSSEMMSGGLRSRGVAPEASFPEGRKARTRPYACPHHQHHLAVSFLKSARRTMVALLFENVPWMNLDSK